MVISATVKNAQGENDITVSTQGKSQPVLIPAKAEGFGSSVNGGELLFLALATCFCNDVYREAAVKGLKISAVKVTVTGEFGQPGEPASNIVYKANIQAPDHSAEEIAAFLQHVDSMAEVHNTLRKGIAVRLQL